MDELKSLWGSEYNYNPKRDVDHPLVKMQQVSQSIMREADEGRQAKMTATLFTQVGTKKSAQKNVSGQQPSLDSLVDGELAGNHTLSQITDPAFHGVCALNSEISPLHQIQSHICNNLHYGGAQRP